MATIRATAISKLLGINNVEVGAQTKISLLLLQGIDAVDVGAEARVCTPRTCHRDHQNRRSCIVAIGKNGSGVALVLRREVTLTWTWLQSRVLSRRRWRNLVET
jgi:hypothetical protein